MLDSFETEQYLFDLLPEFVAKKNWGTKPFWKLYRLSQ